MDTTTMMMITGKQRKGNKKWAKPCLKNNLKLLKSATKFSLDFPC